ncbi:hypothetical protein [Bradyrhizobium japonicum]|uniref:hypothetical protein n=1 Tax=Bradyrhizobium japonicum TaxID=375 RepID=UPI001BA97B9E|nr:hypothetical protein [Bradyrhizobium japonicum]MBR0959528.1 hypothetical protein [Bradyrhizobium japonicum]
MAYKAPTQDQIRAMTSQQRAVLYENAKRRADEGGQEIIDFINASGLSLSDGDMLSSDPDYMEMERIIWSPQGREAAIRAVEEGLPALAGVDPLIHASLGERYHPHNAGTINAGVITAALMRHLGYIEVGPGTFPGRVAKSGMKWRKPAGFRGP